MHSWFALNPSSPAIIEVKGIHQFDWLTRDNVPILEAVESHFGVQNYYHGNHLEGANLSDTTPRSFASKLQARSPKYILSLLSYFGSKVVPDLILSFNWCLTAYLPRPNIPNERTSCSTQYFEANNLPRSEFIMTLLHEINEIASVVKLLSLSWSLSCCRLVP
ncbi:putative galacturonosyltransferase 13 [Tanacetum coccineum]